MKKVAALFFSIMAGVAGAVEFGDIPADYPLYTTGDPFAISLATNNSAEAQARFALIEAETNDWRTAYGWGDHALAGYLGASAWQSWLGTNTYVKAEQDAVALAALATQRVARVHDSAQPSRYFMEVVNSTGTVFEVTGPFTNLMVTLTYDFEETATHTRPAWTNNVFPFTDGSWSSQIFPEYYSIRFSGAESYWVSATLDLPATLTALAEAQGAATVSVARVYYTTNVFAHFTTEAELEAAKAACGVVLTNTVNEAVSNLTADITSATNALMPYTRTLYADITKTNEAGYAAFNATNAAVASYSALIPSSAVGSFTNIFRYNFNSVRKFGVLTNTAWFVKGGFGSGYKAVSTVVSVKDAAGNLLVSSASQPVNIDATVTTQAAITNTLAIPLNVYSGTVEVACIAVSTNASFSVRLYTGGQYASSLSFGEAPIPYATVSDVSGMRLGGATNITDGVTHVAYTEATRTFDISEITGKAITNGMGGLLLATNATGAGFVKISGSGGGWSSALEVAGNVYLSDWGGARIRFPSGSFVGDGVFYGNLSEMGFKSWLMGAERWVIRSQNGNAYIDNGSLTVAGTNAAAVVQSQGPVLLGPTISGKQAHIFTDGTNFCSVGVNGETNTFSPRSIIKPISASSTNVVIVSTNSVYYVALTNAANVSFDFSGLSLGGTKQAAATVYLDCLNTQALYSVINTNAIAMDCAWEPTVTGRYELVVSSDGVRTTARQTWPRVENWHTLKYVCDPASGWNGWLQRFHVDNSSTNSLIVDPGTVSPLIFVRFNAFLNINKPITFEYGYSAVVHPGTDKPSVVYGPFGRIDGGDFMDSARPVEFGSETSSGRLLQVWIGNQSPEAIATVMFYPSRSRARAANALERAAYNAGAYPSAFRLDY